MKPWRFAALAAALAVLMLVAARIDGARREQAALAPVASYADDPALIPGLEARLERTPRDGRGWVILARLNFASDRFEAAARAYERALAVSRKVAQDPQVWCELADALGMAQGGSLKGRPREMIDKALNLKGSHPRSLEMAGSAAYETRSYDRALLYWEPLLAQLDPQTREHRELKLAVERLRRLAGIALAESEFHLGPAATHDAVGRQVGPAVVGPAERAVAGVEEQLGVVRSADAGYVARRGRP